MLMEKSESLHSSNVTEMKMTLHPPICQLRIIICWLLHRQTSRREARICPSECTSTKYLKNHSPDLLHAWDGSRVRPRTWSVKLGAVWKPATVSISKNWIAKWFSVQQQLQVAGRQAKYIRKSKVGLSNGVFKGRGQCSHQLVVWRYWAVTGRAGEKYQSRKRSNMGASVQTWINYVKSIILGCVSGICN